MSILFGPLAGLECRRSASRMWPIALRTLFAAAGMLVVFCVLWWWAFRQGGADEPLYLPFDVLRGGLLALEGMALTVALVLCPALLAGSLAGERERGALGLLLTTSVSAREVVVGRLAGQLGLVAMILLASLPNLALLAALAGFSAGSFLALIGLQIAVAFGASGVALAASAVSKRGRDALFTIYALVLLALLIPLLETLGPAGFRFDWADSFNPFSGVSALVWGEHAGRALATIGGGRPSAWPGWRSRRGG